MKKTGIAVAVLLAAGAAATGGAWYTGNQLEAVLNKQIAKTNQQFAEQLPGTGLKLELTSFEKGLFSSEARYRLQLGKLVEDGQGEVLLADHIEHGPFPLSRLLKLKLVPVMAAAHTTLERNAFSEPWFVVAGEGVQPMEVHSAIGYDESVSGTLHLAALQHSDKLKVAFSGMDVDFDVSKDAEKVSLDGRIDSLQFSDENTGALDIRGVTFDSARNLGASGLYLGEGHVRLDSLTLTGKDQPTLSISRIEQYDQAQESNGLLEGRVEYRLDKISYGDKELGSSTMTWTIGSFDVAAVKSLSDLYNAYMLRAGVEQDALAAPEFSEAEEQQLKDGLLALLEAKPRIALEDFALKTANGESHFSLKIGFTKPESLDAQPEELVKQLISNLNVRLQLAKATISDLISYKAVFEPGLDASAVAAEATATAAMVSEMASAMQVARLDGETLVSTFDYANGEVNFNGQVMPVEDFAMLVGMLSSGGMGGADDAQLDDDDGEYGDGLYDEEAEQE